MEVFIFFGIFGINILNFILIIGYEEFVVVIRYKMIFLEGIELELMGYFFVREEIFIEGYWRW